MDIAKKVRIRMTLVFLVLIVLLGGIIARLFYLQVLHYEKYARFAAEQSQGNLMTLPVRGKVLDRHLHSLAESLDTKSVVLTASKFDPENQSLQKVSDALDVNLEQIRSLNEHHSRLTYLKRKLAPDELARIQDLWDEEASRTSGIFLIPDTKRYYPQQELASHILGFTGLDDKGYDNHGLEGLEFYYDHYLRGHAQRYSVPMDARRNSLNSWELDVKNAGYNLVLTIDKNIQYMVERELEATFRDERAKHATVIVMDPHTGEILAMANRPDYNPNNFSQYPPNYYRNLAVAWDYEPGSTFKVIQTAAAFEEEILGPYHLYDNQNGFIDPAVRPMNEWKERGYLSVEDILVQSSNIGAMKISEQLGESRFYEYIQRFGFGQETGIDLPGEVTGILRPPQEWSKVSMQSLSIGQEISVTPLQMVRAFAVIANGGILYAPYVVKEIQQIDGTPILRVEPTKVRRVISRKTAHMLRDILAKVVSTDGTGKHAIVPGYQVAGKTGTAQKFNNYLGDYSEINLVTSFIGFAPADYPQVVIGAIIDEPAHNEWGGTVAAPLFQRIAERVLPYLDIPSDHENHELIAYSQRSYSGTQ